MVVNVCNPTRIWRRRRQNRREELKRWKDRALNLNDTLGRLQERMSSLEKAGLSSTARSDDAPSEPSVEEEGDEEQIDMPSKEDITQRLVMEMERLIEDGLHAKESREGGDAKGGVNKDDVNLTKALEELVSRTLLKADADEGMEGCPMPIVIVNRSC